MRAMKLGVVLFQLGGPDSIDAVEPFLRNLFNDPDIIDIPFGRLVRSVLSRFIAWKRAPHAAKLYGTIGGKSPIGETTLRQAAALEAQLNYEFDSKVVIAMRYCAPDTGDALDGLADFAPATVVLLPLYPQYSKTTTGSSFNEWDRQISRRGVRFDRELRIDSYHAYSLYCNALIEKINERLASYEEKRRHRTHILFSAHGLPVRTIERGDPYKNQIEETVAAVMTRGQFTNSYSLAYQSRIGTMKWLEPFTRDEVVRLAGSGVKNLLLVPVSFVSDHLETLHELGIEIREHALGAGIKYYDLTAALDDSPRFITALRNLVVDRINSAEGSGV